MNSQIIDRSTLSPAHDPMGAAIKDYALKGHAAKLRVLSSMFDDDEMPVDHLFRTTRDMPMLEQKALQMARGRILDVGAGAGCHSLALQQEGKAVWAIDISPLSCEAMKLRGVTNVECRNLFDPELAGGYDTILMLMNGIGIAGKAERLPMVLTRLKALLNDGGQVLVDSTDLRYIYETDEDTFDLPTDGYYGEVDYTMKYKRVEGKSFDWLYADYNLLSAAAASCHMRCTLVTKGEHYDYLAAIEK